MAITHQGVGLLNRHKVYFHEKSIAGFNYTDIIISCDTSDIWDGELQKLRKKIICSLAPFSLFLFSSITIAEDEEVVLQAISDQIQAKSKIGSGFWLQQIMIF